MQEEEGIYSLIAIVSQGSKKLEGIPLYACYYEPWEGAILCEVVSKTGCLTAENNRIPQLQSPSYS